MRPIMTRAQMRSHQVGTRGRDYSESDDGYSDMEAEAGRGWRPLAGWGSDGWDLGDWPFVVVYVHATDETRLLEIVEGDRTEWSFPTREDRDAAIDYCLLWYGADNARTYETWAEFGLLGNEDAAAILRLRLEQGTLRVPERFRGPYRTIREEERTA